MKNFKFFITINIWQSPLNVKCICENILWARYSTGASEQIIVLGNVRDYAKGTTQTKRGIGVWSKVRAHACAHTVGSKKS